MAEKVSNYFQASIWYGLEAEKLKFEDYVNVEIENDKLACYQSQKTMIGNDKGTNLLRIPIYRVNGFLFDTVEQIKALAEENYNGEEMKGETIREGAEWLAENVNNHKKALIMSYKGAKNAPVNVIFSLPLSNRGTYKKFITFFEQEKAKCIAERKEKLKEKQLEKKKESK